MRLYIEKLFHEVADLTPEARARYFEVNVVDPQIRTEVEALLAFDSHATSSLTREVGEVAALALARVEPEATLCGRYRVGSLLGRGGMGTVHLAERVDGEVAQQVAVKLLRPGADSPELRQRFLAERQILASLSHPNIARLLDAGHRDDGQPYLVMEYVEGKAIDVYAKGFSIRQKVSLFLKVCAAVGHLHRNLVVHRDLKPANILVTAEGEPKILDFGIAKMLDEASDATVTGMRMLTPDYASPEQVIGGQVTTATDIYSLGAVLYRLLTGGPLHQFNSDSPAAVAAAIAGGEITPPSRLLPALKGDLEMILLKALRKEPFERYATTDQFSEDLENYLEWRPIRARKGDSWYRTRRFLRRYWLPVAAITLAVAGPSVGVIVANRERAIAQRRFAQVRQVANKLFDIEAEVRQIPGTTKARELIIATSLDYLERLAAEVHGDPELAEELGNAYIQVARVQGVPSTFNLGHIDQADKSLQVAERLVDPVLRADPRNRTAIFRLARISHDRMLLAQLHRNQEETLRLAQKTAELLARYESTGKVNARETDELVALYMNVGSRYAFLDRYDEAIRLASRARDISQAAGLSNRVGSAQWSLANAYFRKADFDQAIVSIREAVRLLEPPPDNKRLSRVLTFASALVTEGEILGDETGFNLGRPDEALVPLQRAYGILDDLARRDRNDNESRNRLFSATQPLADNLARHDPLRALGIYDHTLSRLAELPKDAAARRKEAWTLANSAYPLRRLGRNAEVRRRLDRALAQLKELKLYPAEGLAPEVYDTLFALADVEAATGNEPRAIEIYQELLRKTMAATPNPVTGAETSQNVSRIYTALAKIHRRRGRNDLAADLDARRLDLWRRWDTKLPNNNFVRKQLAALGTAVQ